MNVLDISRINFESDANLPAEALAQAGVGQIRTFFNGLRLILTRLFSRIGNKMIFVSFLYLGPVG